VIEMEGGHNWGVGKDVEGDEHIVAPLRHTTLDNTIYVLHIKLMFVIIIIIIIIIRD
jgi:hypothetical protein